MLSTKFGFAQHLVAEFATALHDGSQHLIIATSCKENLARVQLEKSASNRPHIDPKIIGDSKYCPLLRAGQVDVGKAY